jgi:hypothetical protein
MLLTLLFLVTVLVVGFTVLLPTFTFQMKRDQEQELIHRGVQYSRAIRAYYKKFGRYPTRLEDLDNTNNLRFLRKRYKDPINQKDFKLLHLGDQGVTLSGGIAGGMIPGATPAGAVNGQNGSGLNGSGSLFNSSPGGSSFNSGGFSNSGSNGVNPNGVFAQSSPGGLGANSNSGTGQTGTTSSSSSGSDSSQNANQTVSQAPGTTTAAGDATSSGQQVIAAGPIVGVESISKKDSIREFNHKKKYNEWQFVYDPTLDRGGLLSTPNQPPLQTTNLQQGQNGQSGSNNGSAFGPSSGSSFGSSPGGFGGGMNGPGNSPQQPPSNPPSPQ